MALPATTGSGVSVFVNEIRGVSTFERAVEVAVARSETGQKCEVPTRVVIY